RARRTLAPPSASDCQPRCAMTTRRWTTHQMNGKGTMAARSARSPDKLRHHDDEKGAGIADFLFRHRGLVGGVTAFAVAFTYVGANAIWYQPHAHGSALFATRTVEL